MRIGLINLERKIVNAALMQISKFYKQQGDTVEWYNPHKKYEKIYCSSIFSFTDKRGLPTGNVEDETGLGVNDYDEPNTYYMTGGWYSAGGSPWGNAFYLIGFQTDFFTWRDDTYQDYTAGGDEVFSGFAIKIEEWKDMLKELPPVIIFSIELYETAPELYTDSDWTHLGERMSYVQKSELAGYPFQSRLNDELVNGHPLSPVDYWQNPKILHIPLSTQAGKWYLAMPQVFAYIIQELTDPYAWYIQTKCTSYGVIVPVLLNLPKIMVPIEIDGAKEGIWTRDMTYHVDCYALDSDTETINPNPPTWHYKPYGELEWVSGSPPHFDVFVKSKLILCEDLKGLYPLKYRMVCAADENYNSEWTTGRSCSVKIDELEIPFESLDNKEYSQGSESLQINGITGDYTVGETLLFVPGNIVMKVTAYNTETHILNLSFETKYGIIPSFPKKGGEDIFDGTCILYNISKSYSETIWNDIISLRLFQPQVKNLIDVETKKGEAEYPAEPEKLPVDIVEELFGPAF